jgi:ankyrin repeat protein
MSRTIVKSFLDHPKVDPNIVVHNGQTGLICACEIGDPNIVKLFLDREGIIPPVRLLSTRPKYIVGHVTTLGLGLEVPYTRSKEQFHDGTISLEGSVNKGTSRLRLPQAIYIDPIDFQE